MIKSSFLEIFEHYCSRWPLCAKNASNQKQKFFCVKYVAVATKESSQVVAVADASTTITNRQENDSPQPVVKSFMDRDAGRK